MLKTTVFKMLQKHFFLDYMNAKRTFNFIIIKHYVNFTFECSLNVQKVTFKKRNMNIQRTFLVKTLLEQYINNVFVLLTLLKTR